MACMDGVIMMEEIASIVTGDEWARPTPCPEWSAADLLGHTACIAEDYNSVVSGLTAGSGKNILRGADIDCHNAVRLRQIAQESPDARLKRFGDAARAFVWKSAASWHRAAFELGDESWTVGKYAAICSLEWHIHAWDLGWSVGISYRPANAETLAEIWKWAFPHLALPAGDPWGALLLVSGRDTGRILTGYGVGNDLHHRAAVRRRTRQGLCRGMPGGLHL